MRIIYLLLASLAGSLQAQTIGDIEIGLAKVFDSKYQGSETAYGVSFNNSAMVGAHKLYPYNAVVTVENQENNRKVSVKIVDKGPYHAGHIIQLSQAAANQLGMTKLEDNRVKITLVSMPGESSLTTLNDRTDRPRPSETTSTTTPPAAPTPSSRQPAPDTYGSSTARINTDQRPATEVSTRETSTTDRATSPTPAPAQKNKTIKSENQPVTQGQFGPGLYQLQLNKGPGTGFGVQVASISSLENAMDKVIELQGQWFDNIMVRKVGTGPLSTYKIILGPWPTREAADSYKSDLKRRYKVDGFVVPLNE
ncbi:MAG: RlpA-like double-psi beta-barrel domain-containing protein [Bacteroidota bacterium]